MNHIYTDSDTIANTPIVLEEKILLEEINYHATHSTAFSYPDSPELDTAHIHDDYEIYVHVSGNCSFLVKDSFFELKRGDIILTRPGDVHFLILNSPCETEHFCLWFSPSCGNELFEFSSRPEFSNLIRLKEADTESVLLGLDKITDSETAVTKFEKLSIILHLILSMTQKNGANDADTIGISPELKEIIAYINREFQSIEKLTDITQRFNISSATLNRWFKKNIHISPQEYLKARRLSHAKQLLDNGASVTESCMMSGFSDCSYFISVFKQKFGETPHKYKKRLQ